MASPRSAWGIDLGNRALKAVKLVRDGDTIRVDDFEIIEHEQILSVSGDNKESLLQAALARFAERQTDKKTIVSVGVSGQQSFARFIKLPPVEDKKIPEIVKFEAIQQIPFPLEDVEWAYQLFRHPESPDVEVGIFAMKRDLVNKQIAYFTSLGLNVQAVQMMPLAVYNAMHYDGRCAQTTMFMDCGADATDLIIAEGDSVWLRTLPIGGNSFTEALAKAFKLNFAKAEELKRTAATSKYAKQIFQAMRPVFADLVAEIQRSIGFYASVHRDARINRIVALGSTFQLPGLQKYLQQNLQLPVEKIDSFKAAPPTDSKQAALFQESMISLAGAYGLALQGLEEGHITSSLLPTTIKRQKMWQEKTPWFALAAACFVVGAGAAYARWYVDNLAYQRNADIRRQNQETLTRAKGISNEWLNKVQSAGADDRRKILNMNALLSYREVWPSLMTDIFKAAPTDELPKLKAQPRAQRKLVVLESVNSRYEPDLEKVLAENLADVAASIGPSEATNTGGRGITPTHRGLAPTATPGTTDGTAPAPVLRRGFAVVIRGYTTYRPDRDNDASGFLHETFVTALQKPTIAQQLNDKKPYHVSLAQIVRVGPREIVRTPQGGFVTDAVADDPDKEDMTSFGTRGTPGIGRLRGEAPNLINPLGRGGRPILGGGRPARPDFGKPDPKEEEELRKCPVFIGETIEKDTVFTVVAIVEIDPKEKAAADSDGSNPTVPTAPAPRVVPPVEPTRN